MVELRAPDKSPQIGSDVSQKNRQVVINGDVPDGDDTTRTVQAAGEALIKCVMQMSMILRERVWQNMM